MKYQYTLQYRWPLNILSENSHSHTKNTMLYDFIYMKCSQQANQYDIKPRVGGSKDQTGLLMGMGFLHWQVVLSHQGKPDMGFLGKGNENILKLDYAVGFTTLWYTVRH